MLVLGRKRDERIFIGDDIVITLVRADRGRARIGIEAPPHVHVVREELRKRGEQDGLRKRMEG